MVKLLVLCGPPATGKGYFTNILEKTLHNKGVKPSEIQLIPVGDVLREEISKGNELAKKISIHGETPETCNILMSVFAKRLDTKAKFVIIDGLPRTMLQLKKFEEITKKLSVYIIFLHASENILVKRMLERAKEQDRADDNLKTFNLRMSTYKKCTLPAIKEMAKIYKNKFIKVATNSDMTERKVKNILKKLNILLNN
ncbi:MAG: nucleoside monophosphate kinase [Alphaproteobacteria bacterium]